MGLFGLVKGVGKTLIGVATGDGEMIAKGFEKDSYKWCDNCDSNCNINYRRACA